MNNNCSIHSFQYLVEGYKFDPFMFAVGFVIGFTVGALIWKIWFSVNSPTPSKP